MTLTLLILSGVIMLLGVALLPRRPLYSPALAYLGLLGLSFCTRNGYQLLPVNGTMLIGWLCMTVVVMLATIMQPEGVRRRSDGTGYMIVGAIAGLAVGLLGFTVSANIALLYGIMVVATAAGIFLGFLLYSRTPRGAALAPGSGNFFRYLLAKGFPTAITVMQIGVVLVLLVALTRYSATAA